MKARKTKGWEVGRKIAHGNVRGVVRHAHGWCVDFVGTPEDLIEAGLAVPSWFKGEVDCKRVLIGARRAELYRLYDEDEYELSIPYREGDPHAQHSE